MANRRFSPARPTALRRGFTFMEILFSVMILGIGFIMVAAMFPAALKQTQANVESAQYNVIVRTAQNDMQNLAYALDPNWAIKYASTTPAPTAPRFLDRLTGWGVNDTASNKSIDYDPSTINTQTYAGHPVLWSFHDPRFSRYAAFMTTAYPDNAPELSSSDIPQYLWDMVRGNLISPDNKEYAWVPLWGRGQHYVAGSANSVADASLQLLIFPVRSRSKPAYDPQANLSNSGVPQANPSCDLTFNPANIDPVVITMNYNPPSSTTSTNAPLGVLTITKVLGKDPLLPVTVTASINPITEGAYVVVSDDQHKIVGNYPNQYNGMVFKIGAEVHDTDGTPGTKDGTMWSVAEVHNLPTERPFNISSVNQIPANAFGAQDIDALVIGRQPDPADPLQQSTNRSISSAPLNRIGPAQGLGFYPTSVPLQ